MYWACKAISDEMSDCLNKHATQKDFDREKATFLQERNELGKTNAQINFLAKILRVAQRASTVSGMYQGAHTTVQNHSLPLFVFG